MVSSPNIWNISEDILVDLFVGDPNTGLGLTGQSGFITLTIEKRSTSLFWNASAFISATPVSLTMTEVSSTNSPGLYRFVLSGTTGNTEAAVYLMHASVNNAPTVEGDTYEIHVSRNTDVRVYESEPVIIT